MTAQEAGRRTRGLGWLLWAVLASLWLATLPLRPLIDPDEGRYAEIPREMAATGDWVTPRLNGLKYFEKPPLQYWATAAVYSVFGVSEWTARLWTVGLAFCCLPMVFAWTSRLYGQGAALAAFVALAVSPYYELVAHLNILDAGFTFWLASAVFAFTLAQCASERSPEERRWMLVAWACGALAVLSKGIVVGPLVGGALVAYSVLERDIRPWRRLHVIPGLALFALICVPWFVAVSVRNPSFLEFFFVHEHFARFLTTVHRRTEPWWFFVQWLLIGALPWLAILPRAIRGAWLDTVSGINFKPLKFLLIFCVVTLTFFSLSESKLAPYILPLFPPLAAIVGVRMAQSATFARTLARVDGVLLPLLAVGLAVYAHRHFGFLPGTALPWLISGGLIALYGVIATWKREMPTGPGPAWAAAACAILGWQCLLSAFAQLPERSSYRLVSTIKPLIRADTPLYTIGQYRETLSPYLGRTMDVVDFEGELQFGLSEEPARRLTREEFLSRWTRSPDAVAFMAPELFDAWQSRGLQGKVLGGDNQTLVIGRR